MSNASDVGLYKTGQFWSWANTGISQEWDLINHNVIGLDDPYKTGRIIVFLHETSHYLHDLSLGACMASDYTREESFAALLEGLRTASTRKARVQAPLMKSGEMERWLADSDLRLVAERVKECEDWIEAAWSRPPSGLLEYCASRKHFAEALDCIPNLTGDAVCEGLVAAKTLWALNDRIGTYADLKYLETIKHSLQVFPESLPSIYSVAHRVYDAALGNLIDPQRWRLEEIWPTRYFPSPRGLSDLGFMYLADIALHIPPRPVALERERAGRNVPEDFLPPFRFCMAIDSLRRRDGFPPDDPDQSEEVFYAKVFDTIASDPKLRWPSYGETNFAWKHFIAASKARRGAAADGYRFRLAVERELKPHTVVTREPVSVLWRHFAPIMQVTRAGFRFLRGWFVGDMCHVLPIEWPYMPTLEMLTSSRAAWIDTPGQVPLDAALRNESSNSLLLHQEAIVRSISVELHSAILRGKEFSCPFRESGCIPNATRCDSLTRLTEIGEDCCCARVYLARQGVDPSCVSWTQA